jgi:MFS family permease
MPSSPEIARLRDAAARNERQQGVIGGAAAQSHRAVAAPAASWTRLVLVGLGISVVPFDKAVNIVPDITGSFGLHIPMIQWVVICYVLTHAGLMLAFGRAGDIWGHGLVFRAGLLWSIVAFLMCAAAPSVRPPAAVSRRAAAGHGGRRPQSRRSRRR